MRTFPLTIILLLAPVLAGVGQMSVEVVIDQEQFLRDESLPIKVRVTNRSGQTLQFGKNNEWLSFVVEGLETGPVNRLADVPVLGEFTLKSAQVATRQVDLLPCFDLNETGRYRVTAVVKIPEWNEEVASKPKGFEIVRGTKLWQQEFGVPRAEGPPEKRRFVLLQASYRKHLKLYLRLTNLEETKVFRVDPIGPLVSFSHPEAQIDGASYLHVLFQTGPRNFLFQVINPDGDVVLRQSYDYSPNRPVLRAGEDGRIYVAGGTRHVTPSDLPRPAPAPEPGAPTAPDAPERPVAPKPAGNSAPLRRGETQPSSNSNGARP